MVLVSIFDEKFLRSDVIMMEAMFLDCIVLYMSKIRVLVDLMVIVELVINYKKDAICKVTCWKF